MKCKKKSDNKAVAIQTSSMVDIVFLLLIFFIVASQMKEMEVEKEVSLPIADASLTKKVDGTQEILINVLPDNRIKVAGNYINATELSKELVLIAEKDESILKKIVIRGDQKSYYGRIMRIMAACAEANIWNVSFAAFQEPEDEGLEGQDDISTP